MSAGKKKPPTEVLGTVVLAGLKNGEQGMSATFNAHGRHHPNGLLLTGFVALGAVIEPKSKKDAKKMMRWLQKWCDKQDGS